MSGTFYMIDKVKTFDSELRKEFIGESSISNGGVNLMTDIHLSQVTIQANEYKIAIYDMNQVLKDVIYFENVYPRNDELEAAMNIQKSTTKGRRGVLEEMKTRVMNVTDYANDITMSFSGFYCISIFNEPKQKKDR